MKYTLFFVSVKFNCIFINGPDSILGLLFFDTLLVFFDQFFILISTSGIVFIPAIASSLNIFNCKACLSLLCK